MGFVPSRFQQDIFDFMEDGKGHALVEAVAGSGKCLGKGTPVLMFDGEVKAVEDIQVGDLLMGPDSQPREVLSTCSDVGPLFKITPTKGDPWVCNDVHILTLVHSVTDETFDVPLNEYLESPGTRRHVDAKLFRVPVNFPDQGPEPFYPGYLVGLWIGDGNRSGPQFTVDQSEREILDYLFEYARQSRYTFKSRPDKRRPNVLTIRLSIADKGEGAKGRHHLRQFLRMKCVVGDQKTIPQSYLLGSRDLRLELLAGILDSDGSLHGNCFEVTSKWEHLAEQYLFLARSIGLAAYCSEKVVNGKIYYRVMISGNTDIVPTRVPRKQAKVRLQKKNALRTGFRVEAIGDGRYYGFTLDEDGRFLLGDFTVTHNTTTMVEAMDFTTGSTLFCAFNKAIANELRKKAPKRVDVGTLHSIGLKIIRRNVGRVDVYDKKSVDLIKAVVQDATGVTYVDRGLRNRLRRLVSLAKSTLHTADTFDKMALEDLTRRYGVDINGTDPSELVTYVQDMLRRSLTMDSTIDFDDMIWMPAVYLRQGSWTGLSYKWVMVDEAQDLNLAQQELVFNLIAKNGRMVAVGDRKQSIYGFRGADALAMEKIEERFNAKTLPLSICYRCPKKHVELAKKIVPQIEASETAIEGVVANITRAEMYKRVKSGDLVMCRRNAPLINLAFELIRRGVKAVVRGRDIGQGLVSLVERSNKTELIDLVIWLEEYRAREVVKLRQAEREVQAQSVEDRVDCLMALSEGATTITELKSKIRNIFSDDVYGVVLSSIHRAKGLEANRTFLLEMERMPLQWAKQQDWQLDQEINLQYVALTRSKRDMFFVDSPPYGALFLGPGEKNKGPTLVDMVPSSVPDQVVHETLREKRTVLDATTGDALKAALFGKPLGEHAQMHLDEIENAWADEGQEPTEVGS